MSDKIKKISKKLITNKIQKASGVSATEETTSVKTIKKAKEAKKQSKINTDGIKITKENKKDILKILESETKELMKNQNISSSKAKSIERAIEMIIEASQIEEED